ncbi:unnamed protein product [Gordionus sp. m RMFG-2023]
MEYLITAWKKMPYIFRHHNCLITKTYNDVLSNDNNDVGSSGESGFSGQYYESNLKVESSSGLSELTVFNLEPIGCVDKLHSKPKDCEVCHNITHCDKGATLVICLPKYCNDKCEAVFLDGKTGDYIVCQ